MSGYLRIPTPGNSRFSATGQAGSSETRRSVVILSGPGGDDSPLLPLLQSYDAYNSHMNIISSMPMVRSGQRFADIGVDWKSAMRRDARRRFGNRRQRRSDRPAGDGSVRQRAAGRSALTDRRLGKEKDVPPDCRSGPL